MASTNTGGVSFSSSAFTGNLEGQYRKTESEYFVSESGQVLFIGGSCQKGCTSGLWRRTASGKPKYISSLRPHRTKQDTFIFDSLIPETQEKEYYLLMLKEDRLRIVLAGGENAL